LTSEVQPGASDSIRFPRSGPYDARLGYGQMPQITERLKQRGYVLAEQARMSPGMVRLMDRGIFPPYREKNQAGLALRDCNGLTLVFERYPQRQYEDFAAVPPLLVGALLFCRQRLSHPRSTSALRIVLRDPAPNGRLTKLHRPANFAHR
jgi:membrane peptidoglycan carboxypeptidase